MKPKEVILKATELRSKSQPEMAIKFLKPKLDEIKNKDPDILLNAYLELVKSSLAADDKESAVIFAREGSKEDPNLPTFKKVIEKYG